MPLPAVAGAALKLAPLAAGPFHRSRHVNWGGYQRWINSLRPTGYVTPEDQAAAQATETRLARGASATAGSARLEANRRGVQRGINTAPAMEATFGRIGQQEAAGRQSAAEAGAEQLYTARQNNQRFEQQKTMDLIGARLRSAGLDETRNDAQTAGFYNSMLEYAPTAIDSIDKIMRARGSTAPARTFNHATGRFENAGGAGGTFGGGVGAQDTGDYAPSTQDNGTGGEY